jgi:hypothetical protein
MKRLLIPILLLSFFTSFAQWTRVQQLPSTDIFSLYHKDSVLYAGGKNCVYISKDKGQTWDSTSFIPGLTRIDNIIVYKDELFVSSFSKGVFKTIDRGLGNTWLALDILPFVSDFVEWRGVLYASTLGEYIYKLDPLTNLHWLLFNNGLSDFSVNVSSIAATSTALIGSTLNNGIYDRVPFNSTTWSEAFLTTPVSVNEAAYDIVTAHDSLFFTGRTGRFYMSTNTGVTWNRFGATIPSDFSCFANAKQALLLSNYIGIINTTQFFYIKKDSLTKAFVPFGFVVDHFTYKLDIIGDKLWDASTKGLFFMSLSDLPGISSAEDTTPLVVTVPPPVEELVPFRVFPNPTTDKVLINIGADSNSNAIIQLFDSKGALVKLQKEIVTTGNNQFSVDMKSLASGVYHLSIVWENGKMHKTVQVLKR